MVVRPPSAANAAAYLSAVRGVVTPQRFAMAVDMIFRRAEASGDLEAFKAVAPYVVGSMRNLEDDGADDVVMRIMAVVEQRRRAIGERQVLEPPTVDGAFEEIGEGSDAEDEAGIGDEAGE